MSEPHDDEREEELSMLVNCMAQLDRATIALELSRGGRKTLLRGWGAYSCDPELGKILTVSIAERGNSFDFVLREDLFDGIIASGADSGCDFQICLES